MNIKELEKVLNSELNLGHYHVLSLIHCKNDIETENQLINGWINALHKRGLIVSINDNYELTEKGKEELINIIGKTEFIQTNKEFLKDNKIFSITKTDQKISSVTCIVKQQTLEQFAEQLHVKITAKIKELTNKNNIRNTSGKMLHSNSADFKNRLESFFKKYKKVNAPYDKIERVLLKYTEDVCTGERKFAPTILYYIWKQNEKDGLISEMLGAIENLGDEKEEIKEIINIKELF